MRLHRLIALLAMMAAVLQPEMSRAGDHPERGLSIASQWCQSCHIVTQDDPGMDDGEAAPRFSTLTNFSAQALRRLLAHGHAEMEGLSTLSKRDVADIAAYMRSLKPETPSPDWQK